MTFTFGSNAGGPPPAPEMGSDWRMGIVAPGANPMLWSFVSQLASVSLSSTCAASEVRVIATASIIDMLDGTSVRWNGEDTIINLVVNPALQTIARQVVIKGAGKGQALKLYLCVATLNILYDMLGMLCIHVNNYVSVFVLGTIEEDGRPIEDWAAQG